MMNQAEKPPSKKWLQFLISLFLIYHLAVIMVLANSSSFLARRLSPLILPYANFFQLNTTWNFFAPDPAHTMFVKYKIEFNDDNGNEIKEPVIGFIPPEKKRIVIDSSKRRFLYAMRFLLMDNNRMQTILGPWLCRENPGASRIFMENRFVAIPSLDDAILNSTSLDPENSDETTAMKFSYNCNETKRDEVSSAAN